MHELNVAIKIPSHGNRFGRKLGIFSSSLDFQGRWTFCHFLPVWNFPDGNFTREKSRREGERELPGPSIRFCWLFVVGTKLETFTWFLRELGRETIKRRREIIASNHVTWRPPTIIFLSVRSRWRHDARLVIRKFSLFSTPPQSNWLMWGTIMMRWSFALNPLHATNTHFTTLWRIN